MHTNPKKIYQKTFDCSNSSPAQFQAFIKMLIDGDFHPYPPTLPVLTVDVIIPNFVFVWEFRFVEKRKSIYNGYFTYAQISHSANPISLRNFIGLVFSLKVGKP
jgi:hypothetical protein